MYIYIGYTIDIVGIFGLAEEESHSNIAEDNTTPSKFGIVLSSAILDKHIQP